MLTQNTNNINIRQKGLSLSGGHIVVEQLMLPSYSPNAVSAPSGGHFPWEDEVDVINTPDIDPSFFDVDPFKKSFSTQISQTMDFMADDLLMNNQNCFITSEDSTQQSIQQSLEENVFIDLSQFIRQTNPDINALKESESLVSPNDVLENQYIPPTTAPVLTYLQVKPVQSIASTINMEDIASHTSLIDSIASHSTEESLPHFTSPSHSSSQSYSPALPTSPFTQTYSSPTPSPALSYTSTLSSHSTLISGDGLTSDSNTTIDGLMETIDTKPEPDFLQPTVINDHLYTLPSTSTTKTKRKSAEHKDKYLNVRKKNNMASKKSRITKRDKQKLMDEQIQHYIEDNANCKQMIERMEREIEWCKKFLFQKVVASSRT